MNPLLLDSSEWCVQFICFLFSGILNSLSGPLCTFPATIWCTLLWRGIWLFSTQSDTRICPRGSPGLGWWSCISTPWFGGGLIVWLSGKYCFLLHFTAAPTVVALYENRLFSQYYLLISHWGNQWTSKEKWFSLWSSHQNSSIGRCCRSCREHSMTVAPTMA